MFDTQAFIKLNQDDFNYYIQLLDKKLVNIDIERIKYKKLINDYDETYKNKSCIQKIFELFSSKSLDEYHEYLWNMEKLEILYNQRQKGKAMLDWFIGLKRPIYISIDDYKFILNKEDIDAEIKD